MNKSTITHLNKHVQMRLLINIFFCLKRHFNISSFHNYNMPMQYTVNFNGCKNDNFLLKILIFFLIFAQNIECGYTLEQPH